MDDSDPTEFHFHQCPVCGSENVELKVDVGTEFNDTIDDIVIACTFWVNCNNCGFKTERCDDQDWDKPCHRAIRLWNNNAPFAAKAVEWYRKLKEDNTAK